MFNKKRLLFAVCVCVCLCVCVCVCVCDVYMYVQRSFFFTLSIKLNDVDTASIIKNKHVKNKFSQKDIRTFYVNSVSCKKLNIRYLWQSIFYNHLALQQQALRSSLRSARSNKP